MSTVRKVGRWLQALACAGLLWSSGCVTGGEETAIQPWTSSLGEPASEPAQDGPPQPAQPQPAEREPLVIVAGGDVNLGRDAGQQILADPGYDPFRAVRPIFGSGDLRFINLESNLSEQRGETQSPHHPLVFTGPPGGAETLRNAGIDIVSTANNHAWDYGRNAFLQTMANLHRVDVRYVGGSAHAGRQYQPVIMKAKGWSVAFFAVTHIWNLGPFQRHAGREHVAWANPERLKANLEKARAEHDLVLLSFHGGVEYSDLPYPPQREFIEQAMDMGVDVLIGHHPHVPRGIGWHEGRPAFYSLGNLVFDKRSENRWERTSYLARLTFRPNGERRFEICPYDLWGHEPRPFSGKRRGAAEAELRRHVETISRHLGGDGGGSRVGDSDALGCMPVTPQRG